MAKSTKPITEIFSITADTMIRPWQEDDRPFLRTLYLHARRVAWPWLDNSEWQLEDFDAATRDEQIWVAIHDGHRVGFASVWENDNFLHNLFVDPLYQRLGVGRLLLEQVQRTFTSTGALKCLVKNERAVAFYQRHGWHIEATGDSPEGEYYLMHYRLG
ncbi:GNAT family N-acetyltransferase [Enterobacter hormaechei]|uniref:GNAT family N-acetyltransferase n=1 Tax=Enterobacter intestinihominis TaxID=3133180 RepID=A0ABV1ZL31_9ENTR|nr:MULTISPECIES: GNAT family N-acetyltransferase [Enterobacter]QLU72781.1 GNAT family N-acetyltransferase [Enterobacter cloacae]QLU92969.1 GNAT family N-acetyltransferase [Enterobacter roggenkampii]TYF79501.1 GNAT family N-acetyltransferase [Klebsiella quasipneumoniae]HCJ6304706.1 GNAT family N-acetyltransferase [Enterobacter hormaechei subsp. xiangfangensis]AOQ02157.1 GNAT family N-acetyltransferase [Enterobacter hormaechei subsp. hoffmannii]